MALVIVSACLMGIRSRYDHRHSLWPDLEHQIADKANEIIAVCPEQLGGLSTPREKAIIKGGDGHDVLKGKAAVISESGDDLTRTFIRGAKTVLFIARKMGVTECFLKDRSPSCGVKIELIENTGPGKTGPGVLAAVLIEAGFKVTEVSAKAQG